MTRSRRARYVDAVLRIVAQPAPAAHYGCLRCGFTQTVRGRDATAAFAASIRTDHRATCPTLHQKGTP